MAEDAHLPANPAARPVECELKFGFRRRTQKILESLPEIAIATPQYLHLRATYFDTPDRLLKTSGVTLRIRQGNGLPVQTVKSGEQAGSVALCRNEWEWPLEQDHPDLAKLAAVPELAPTAKLLDGRLEPVFVTDIQRTVHLLHLDDGAIVEVAIDVGKIICGAKDEPVQELELELKIGDPGSLYRLAASIHERAPLWIFAESKAARGWRVRTGHGGSSVSVCPPILLTGDTVGEALHKIVQSSLGHLVANIAPTLRGEPEGLHQMRIALRACRAALELFAPILGRGKVKRLDRKLRRFVRELGRTRDWDVLCLQTIPAASRAFPGELVPVSEVATAAQQASHRALRKILHGRALTTLILHFAVELSRTSDLNRNNLEMEQPFTQLGPYLLDRVSRKITRRTSHVGGLSTKRLHGLRKRLDRLYDDIAFVEALYPKRHVRAYRARCEALQDILGLVNDAVVTRRLVLGLVKRSSGNLETPGRHLLSWSKERRKAALGDLESAADGFLSAPPFWH